MGNPASKRELFSQADWNDLLPRLLLFSYYLSKGYNGGRLEQNLPNGLTPRDMVSEVITKALTGTRTWNPEVTDLIWFLKLSMRSEYDHLYNSAENKRRSRCSADDELPQSAVHGRSTPFDPEEFLRGEELRQFLIDLAGSDELQQQIIARALDGTKPAEIAQHLKIDVNTVYRCLKKVRAALSSFIEQESKT